MKVITVMQPFATLIAINEKLHETRCWATKYRGNLLIHAGKGKDYMYLCDEEPFKSVLAKRGYNKNNLPMGAIIAKTNLSNCLKIKQETVDTSLTVIKAELEDKTKITGNELKFGDFARGRYAWRLDDTGMLKEPIPVKGQQRLWSFDFKEDK